VLIAAAATTAAARVGEAVDPWLVRLTLICGCMVGAEVVVLARRLLDRDRWYLDALPLRPRAELLAGLSIALLGGAPSALGIGAVLVGIGGAAPLPVLVELLSVLLLAALVMVWTGLRAEARRRLHGRLSLLPAAVAVLAFALLQLSGAPLTLLPLIAGGFFFAFREIGPATRVRRRLETSRRDDDHGAGL
jgi:small basic protein